MSFALLPNGRQQFIDADGNPIVGGTVATYIPGTLTPSDTYADIDGNALNDNPLTLDDLGSAAIWASGVFRQIVKDIDGNLIWDTNTGTIPAGSIQAQGEIILTWTGPQTVATAWLGGEAVAVQQSILATAPGAGGITPKTLPTGTYVITIKLNSSTVGTATMLSSGGNWTFSWVDQVNIVPGDKLDFYGSGDATIADFGITLKSEFT